MSDADLPRDLADRIIRRTLPHPAHLRAFLRQVVPDLAGGFDCDRARPLGREFVLPGWREREADLPFEVPYRTAAEEVWALVCVLIEHQSDTDSLMPLRMLVFVVAYWIRQREEWEKLPRPRPPFRLRPVLPIVLYTGAAPWGSNRTIHDLLDEPRAFHAFAPAWGPLFWNLADHTPEALLATDDAWTKLMAIMRATNPPTPEAGSVFLEAVSRLRPVLEIDRAQWELLTRAIWDWMAARRPPAEIEALRKAAVAAHTDPSARERIEAMAQTAAEAWMEEGKAKGLVEGQVLAIREALRRQLTLKFGALPEAVRQRIESAADLDRLNAALDQVLALQSLDELKL
jgi:hypothetical protein